MKTYCSGFAPFLRFVSIAAGSFVIVPAVAIAVEVGQVDDFQNETTMGWQHGQPNQHAPRIALNEGPGGAGDHALRVSSSGTGSEGSMMVMFNQAQWTGDFLAAGVTGIEFDLRHAGGENASIRVAVQGSGGQFASAVAIPVASGAGWNRYFLSLAPEDLVAPLGGGNVEATLSTVGAMRLLSNPSPSWHGEPEAMELLYDNITAVGAADAIGVENLRVTEVDTEEGTVEVTNLSPNLVTVGQAMPFSYRLNESASIPGGTEFQPGESKVFSLPGLDSSDSDVWLYLDDNFSSPESILSGVKYGPQSDIGRTAVAVAAGIWPDTVAFVPAPPAGDSIQLNSLDPTAPENWIARAPTPNEFFGTGERIEQPLPAEIPPGDLMVGLELLVDGLVSPLGLQDPDDGTGRLFIFDQTGVVWIVQNGVLQEGFFMDVRDRMVTLGTGFDERGLIGFVLHPDFPNTPKIYTHLSEPVAGTPDFTVPRNQPGSPNHHTVIGEWQVDSTNPDRIDPATFRELMRIEQPQGNHNGGTLAFGHDGLLYISLGDGGGGDDVGFGHAPEGNSQNLGVIHGGILRIDPDGSNSANGQYGIPGNNPFLDRPGAIGEFWAYGLRNPYIFSFDQLTGEMHIGDAGQHDIEAVYLGELGANYGWRITEGSFFFRPQRPDGQGFVVTVPEVPLPDDLVNPIAEYTIRSNPIRVIIGGYVYRGSAIPELDGRYVFGDWISTLLYLDEDNTILELGVDPSGDQVGNLRVTGFAQDAQGEVYLLGSDTQGPTGDTGRVYRLVPALLPRVAVVQVVHVDGAIRIQFESDLPAASHRVEARPVLDAPPDWAEVAGDATEVAPGLFRFEIPLPASARHFFRIVAEEE